MKITSNEVIEKLKSVCPDIDETKIDEYTSFKKIPLDSMDIASFMLELEEHYQVKISNADISKLDNVDEVVKYLAGKQLS